MNPHTNLAVHRIRLRCHSSHHFALAGQDNTGSCPSQIAATRPVGQKVKTPPFHGGNMGSIPVRVTKNPDHLFDDQDFLRPIRRNEPIGFDRPAIPCASMAVV